MLIGETYITSPKPIPQRPLIEVVTEVCEETQPKPLFCELPDDLRLRDLSNSGTAQTYTYTSSSGTSVYGTSTTTT